MARKRVTSSKKSVADLRKKYNAPIKGEGEAANKSYQAPDPREITPEDIRENEEVLRRRLQGGGKESWETGRNRPLPHTKRLSTDDIRNLLIGIPMAIVAGGIAYKSAQKIGYAVTHRGVKRNVEDLKEDAKRQLERSMKSIQRAMLSRQKFLWGRRGKTYHDNEDEE